MSFVDPAALDLKALFRDENMFDSRQAWGRAGFRVIDRSNDGKIMVARHSAAPGLIFKKYTSEVSEKDQSKNYERRLEGSKRLRAFVDARHLENIVIPRKWILDLPRPFARGAHVLVADDLTLLSNDQTKAAYQSITPAVLKDLCVVLFHFRGMDSNAKNLPFVADGRIALVDTEHWDRATSKPYLHQVGEYLSADRRKLANQIFDQLEDGEDEIGDPSDDFFDEEDTSSASSVSSSSASFSSS